jgi:hypothetical protein
MVANRAACDVVLVAMRIGTTATVAWRRSAMIANDSRPRLLHRADTDDRLRDGLHRRMVNNWVVARSGAMRRRMMMVVMMRMMMLAATAIVVVVMIMGEDGTAASNGHQRE